MTLDRPLALPRRPQPSGPRERTRVPPAALALLIAAVPLAGHGWAALHAYFWQDDFIIVFRAASADPLDPAYLFHAHNDEHVAPGMFLLAWAVTAIAPLNYPVAVAPLLVMQALTAVLFWRLLVRLFGARWAILPPFAVFAAAPLILLPTLWWSYGVQLIPLLLAMIGALGAHVRYVGEGRRADAVRALLWVAGGMVFYEKAALIPAVLFGVTVLLAPPAEPVRATLRNAIWLAHLGLIAGYAILYLGLTSTRVGGEPAGEGGFAVLARRLLLDTFLPGLFGGPLGDAGGGVSWDQPPLATRIGAALLAVVVVLGGLVRGGRRARLAWLLLAGYLAVDLALVALTRLPLVGTLAGADPRYVADAVPVAVLCAAFAYLSPQRPHPEPAGRTHPATAALVAVLTAAFLVNATVSHLRLAPAAQAGHARDYVAAARAALDREPGIVLYDGPVPVDILIGWFGPDARTSRVIGLLPGPPRFDRPGETLHLVDGEGRPRRIERLADQVTGAPGPVKDCGHAVTTRPTTIALQRGVAGKRLVRLEYYTADPGEGWLSVAGRDIPVTFERGPHVLWVPVEGTFRSVAIRRAHPIAAVCVVDVEVGVPVV